MFRGIFGSTSAESFLRAARRNDLATVQRYIAENRNNVDAINHADPLNISFALVGAADEGHVAIVNALLAVPGIDPNVTDMTRDTALIVAARRGHTAVIRALLSAPHIKLAVKNNRDETAVSEALSLGHREIANLITTETAGRAFRKAALSGDADTVKRHIAANIDNIANFINATDRNGLTALSRAAGHGNLGVVTALLAVPEIDLNIRDERGLTALSRAAHNGHADCVTALLATGRAKINDVDIAGNTALIHAAYHGHTGVVRVLLENNIDLTIVNRNHLNAIRAAVKRNHVEIVKLLEAKELSQFVASMRDEAAQYARNMQDDTVRQADSLPTQSAAAVTAQGFLDAACNGDLATVQAYIAVHGSDYDAMNVHCITNNALHMAAYSGHAAIITTLGNLPTNVNARNFFSATPLMRAVMFNHPDAVSALLALPHININIPNDEGNTTLMISARNGFEAIATLLLRDNRTDLTLANAAGLTATQIARVKNHVNIAQMIEAAITARREAAAAPAPNNRSVGAASGAANQSAASVTAEQFLNAVIMDDIPTVQAYIAAHHDDRAAMNVINHDNNSAIHLAVLRGNISVITLLGAVSTISVNQFNNYNFNPFMYAAAVGTPEMVTALLSLPQIAVNMGDNLGNTALHLSTQRQREDIIPVLLRDSRVDLNVEDNAHQTAAQLARSMGNINIARMIEREIERRAAASPSSNPPAAYNPSSATNSLGPFRTIAETSTISPQRFLAAARDGELLTVQSYIATHRRNLEGAMNVADPASGNTALIMAASAGREDIVSELLNTQGVNIETQNRNGLNAAQVAQQNGHAEIAVRLMQLLSARAAPIPEPQPNSPPIEAAAAVPKTPSPPIPLNFEQRLAAINFNEDEIPNEFKCPITRCIMNDPVSVSSGQTYDRPALAACFSNGRVTYPDPLTREIIHIEALKNHTNQIIKSVIEKFVSNQEKAYAKRLQEEAEKKAAAQPPQEQAVPQPSQEPAAPLSPPEKEPTSAVELSQPLQEQASASSQEPATAAPQLPQEREPAPTGFGLFDPSQKDQSPEPRTPPSPRHD